MILPEHSLHNLAAILTDLQPKHAEWAERVYGKTPLTSSALGIVEELGELCHALLKQADGARAVPEEEYKLKLQDAWADALIFALGYAQKSGLPAGNCLTMAGRLQTASMTLGDVVVLAGRLLNQVMEPSPDAILLGQFLTGMAELAMRWQFEGADVLMMTWMEVSQRTAETESARPA